MMRRLLKRLDRLALATLTLSALAQGLSCSAPPAREAQTAQTSKSVAFEFANIDGGVLAAEQMKGRVTVLLFVTTFDLSSQTQAKRLEDLFRTHSPRVNVIAVVMEAPKYVDLARSFRDVLGLNYPVGIADRKTLSSHSIFGRISLVPAWVILDAQGVLSATASGALTASQLEEAVLTAQGD